MSLEDNKDMGDVVSIWNFTTEVPGESTGNPSICFQLVTVANDGCKAVP